jgi:hypothetical protein
LLDQRLRTKTPIPIITTDNNALQSLPDARIRAEEREIQVDGTVQRLESSDGDQAGRAHRERPSFIAEIGSSTK